MQNIPNTHQQKQKALAQDTKTFLTKGGEKMKILYDRNGRIKYNSDLHANHNKPWLSQDEKYLIEMYEKIGPDKVALALERTIGTVMDRACELRKKGLMPNRIVKKNFPRNGREE
jgi:hypothetical protein